MFEQGSSSRRYLLLALLYFSEGAPIGYLWWVLPGKLRAAGMPVDRVALLVAMLALPWTFKFIWAPVVDAVQGPRWGLRAWITAMQVLMGLTLLPMAFVPLSAMVGLAFGLVLLHAVCAATQDVAIDAYAIGMLVARSIFGGLVIYIEPKVGERAVIVGLIAAVWLSLAALWLLGERPAVARRSVGALKGFGRHLKSVATRRTTWLGLGIALTAGAGFEAIGGLVSPFLVDEGLAAETRGLFMAFPVVGCMIVGALVGGFLADRLAPRRIVGVGVLGIAAWVLVLVGLRYAFPLVPTTVAGLLLPVYLLLGVLTASLYALLMNLTDPAVAGVQFSTYMGAGNACEAWAVALAGALAAGYGYGAGFSVAAVLSLSALPLLALLPATDKRGHADERP